MNNPNRVGNFTSSKNVALMSMDRSGKRPGKPFHTYIQEKNMERRLGRVLSTEIDQFSTSWGKLVESRVFDLLGTDYRLCSQETLVHQEINCWSGSPDVEHFFEESHLDSVADIKCPSTLKSFCQLVDPIYDGLTGINYFNAIRNGYVDNDGHEHDEHKDGEKFYWQLVSNACITGHKYAELIVYCPYLDELSEIKKICEGKQEFYNIFYKADQALPYLLEGGHYKNLNIVRFEVPEADKDALKERILLAKEELIQVAKLIEA